MLHRRRLLGVAFLALPWVSASGTPGSHRPLGTAVADFDGDSRPDLAVLRPGRLELLLVDGEQGAFRPDRTVERLGFGADLLAAGDFDGDGVVDVVLGERGAATLTTLRGDGHGGFEPPDVTLLPGEVTALAAADVNRRDGLPDWLVGVVDARGAALLVFEGLEGALGASPERIALPAPATAFAAGRFDGSYLADVAAACGTELVVIGGRDRKLHTPGAVVGEPLLRSWPLEEGAEALETIDGERALGILDARGRARVLREGALAETGDPVVPRDPTTLKLSIDADGLDDVVRLDEEGAVAVTPSAPTAAFVVNSTGDTVDAAPGNGVCDDGTGACTLRAALQEANASPGADDITFSLGAGTPTIAPASVMPNITEAVSIRGNTGGATRVQLNGVSVTSSALYFVAGSSGSLVRSLVINRYGGFAIAINSANNTVEDCWIGLDATGSTTVPGNAAGGITISTAGATGNVIGGFAAGTRNVIARNGGPGVRIESDASGNRVRGNYIGTNPGANVAAANSLDGVQILSAGSGNRIENNVISGNTNNGIRLEGASTTGTLIEGNLIGTHGSGLTGIGNGQNGILITSGAASNTVGGTTAVQRNVIAGNGQAGSDGIELNGTGVTGTNVFGNYIGLDASGTAALSNGQDGILVTAGAGSATLGAATATPGSNGGNVIGGNGRNGIRLEGTGSGTAIQGNLIGLRAGGTVAQANVSTGISIAAPGTTVGGASATQRNVVSGGNGVGVGVGGNNAVVQSNFIGTDITGTVKIGGGAVGAADPGTTGITGFLVGGSTSAPGVPPGNVIAPSTVGVSLLGPGVQNALVQGNLIGLNASGVAFGGTGNGVQITFGARNNTIGGTTVSARNVISGNFIGVRLSDNGTAQNIVQGNYIGTDAAGTAAVPNTTGISIESGASSNNVGGSTATPGVAPGNLVSGNTDAGLSFSSNNVSNNAVKGNIVGATADGMNALANRSAGILIGQSATALIGGSAAGERNLISGNSFSLTDSGVNCSDCASASSLRGNWIGVAMNGTSPLPNGIGVAMQGPQATARPSALVVGGSLAGEGNVISGNQTVGVLASDNDGVGTVLGNLIGVAPDGVSPMGNGSHGISVTGFSGPIVGNLTGATPGACTGSCNVIRFNGGAGISFPYAFARETILGNRISDNTELGIDLASAGPTGNDAGDTSLPQNAPVIQVVIRAGSTSIQGTIQTVASTLVNVDVFGNGTPDPSGFGEGDVYLGTATCTTNIGGSCTWALVVSSAPAFLTATATVTSRGTSEFAATFLDSDGDGFGDTFDVCPGVSNPDQIDDDFDGHGNVCDCAPNDGGSFAPVTEIATLTMEPDKQTVSWPSQTQASGTGTLHQLLRGLTTQLPVGGPSEACVASGPAGSFTDASLPPPGGAYWYVVRAKNACATSSYGNATAGPRVSSTCP